MKSQKIDPIFEFTVASSKLSITNLHQQMGDLVGLCRTSLIWLWGKVQKWAVPDLRKTNQMIPQAVVSCLGQKFGNPKQLKTATSRFRVGIVYVTA